MARRRTPALRAFAPDSMVGLAFTQHSTPPDLDDPSYTARADFLFDARRNELDILSAYASPERIPKKRQGAYNTLAVSNEGRAFIVDNQTLEGEPAPNAELAWELHQSMEERLARYHHLPVPPPRLRSHDDDRPSSATPGLWVHRGQSDGHHVRRH